MRSRRALVVSSVFVVVSATAAVTPSVTASATPLSRPADPVVLTGADVPTLQGAGVGGVLGFKANGATWTQIPVQVDERASLDLGLVYHGAASGVHVVAYTSTQTWAGKDPNPKFDADDEIAFMARDSGGVSTASGGPAGTVAGSGVQVHITDPLAPGSDGYVYLFRKVAYGQLQQGAGAHYVKYTFHLTSGKYKTTYNFTTGPNPENSLVTGAYYTHHFADRWLSDSITITAPGASHVDILDRHKSLFSPSYCGRSEDTFDAAEGAFTINKVGAVRGIRQYIGANSGPNTERTHFFYDRREDIVTDLRVHSIPSVMDFFDYSPAVSGMTYRNDNNTAGVTVDGSPDAVTAGVNTWEQVAGAQGTLTMVAQLATTFTPSVTSYYLDDTTPSDTQCTGDAFAYGSSGAYINGTIPCTDPATSCTDTLRGTRTMYFDAPGGTAASAAALRDGVYAPLATSATSWP